MDTPIFGKPPCVDKRPQTLSHLFPANCWHVNQRVHTRAESWISRKIFHRLLPSWEKVFAGMHFPIYINIIMWTNFCLLLFSSHFFPKMFQYMVYFLYFQPQKSPWLFVHISPTSQDLPSSSVQPVCGRFKRDRTRSLRCCLGPLKSWIPSSPRSSDHISLACLFVAFFKQLFFGKKTPNTYVIHNDFIWNIEYACLKMCFRINTINILDYIYWINWYFDLVRKPIHFGVLWLYSNFRIERSHEFEVGALQLIITGEHFGTRDNGNMVTWWPLNPMGFKADGFAVGGLNAVPKYPNKFRVFLVLVFFFVTEGSM